MMTPKEFKAELTAIFKEIGPAASVFSTISGDGHGDVIYCGVYPRGMGVNKGCFYVTANTFEDAVSAIRAKWAEYAAEFHQQTLRKMALAIIRVTSEIGHCTDAALRQEFGDDEVARFGADACREADTMADKGPFTIVALGGSNGAPKEVAAAEGAQVH